MKYLHTMIRVANLDVSLEFYCGRLGLLEVKRTENQAGKYTLVFLATSDDLVNQGRTDAPMIELTYNWDSEIYNEGRNFGHIAFEVDNIYEMCQRLHMAGIVINRPPRDGHMAFIRSPDNISIELLQKGEPLPPQDPWISMPNIGHW
jgi:lactoylglutathione lyase